MRKGSNKNLCPHYRGRQWKQMFTFKGNKFDMWKNIALMLAVESCCKSDLMNKLNSPL